MHKIYNIDSDNGDSIIKICQQHNNLNFCMCNKNVYNSGSGASSLNSVWIGLESVKLLESVHDPFQTGISFTGAKFEVS